MRNMKKLCLLVLCFSISIVVYCETIQRVILSHEGNLTQYDAAHWQDAFTAAVDGDIIYFTPGVFSVSGNLTITKAISLIGAGISQNDCFGTNGWTAMSYSGYCTTGQSTSIRGDITIAIPGSKTLTSPIMEGIRVYGYQQKVRVTEPVTNLTFKRCQFSRDDGGGFFEATATVTNLTIEGCFINNLNGTNVVNLNIHNCYIVDFDGGIPEGTQFVNCQIECLRYFQNCTLTNCIVTRPNYGASSITYDHCILDGYYEDPQSTEIECHHHGGGEITNALITTTYPGIGPFYGSTPFTFKPSQSYVSSSTLNYDSSTKKLNVTMTINKGE